MNQMKNLFMKQLLSLLLCLSIIVPSMAKKEQRKQNVFPDGTPISEWFLQTKVVHPDSLGKKYDLSDYGIESNPHIVQTQKIQKMKRQPMAVGSFTSLKEFIKAVPSFSNKGLIFICQKAPPY